VRRIERIWISRTDDRWHGAWMRWWMDAMGATVDGYDGVHGAAAAVTVSRPEFPVVQRRRRRRDDQKRRQLNSSCCDFS
jgi:hypothetical protein